MATKSIGKQEFEQVVGSDGIVLVDFWAEWCGPCRVFGPVFEAASEKHPDVTFLKVDTEAEQELASGLQIMSIPTLMAFREGVLLYARPGALPAEALDDLITKVKQLDMDDVRQKVAEAEQVQAG